MNISSVIRLIGAVFFLTFLPVLAHALTPGQVFDKVKNSVVVVKILDVQGKVKGQGSGVLLPSESGMNAQTSPAGQATDYEKAISAGGVDVTGTGEGWLRREAEAGRPRTPVTDPELLEKLEAGRLPSGKVATNCHVVKEGASYQVGRGKHLVSATLYAEDGDKDICILDAKGIEGIPAQLGKAVGLKVGDRVYAVGAPQGLELSLSDGIVAQLRGSPSPFIQTTAAISPGSSGGGLFDGEGRLVGLTTFYVEGGQSLNFAMPVEWIGEVKPGRKLVAKGQGQTEWMKRAMALLQGKDYQGLLDWCRKWTKNQPNDAEAWLSLGIAYGYLERYNESIEAHRQALRINPKYVETWISLGIVYAYLERYNESVEAIRQALRNNPEEPIAWITLGTTYLKHNRHNDAIEAYRQALRINPEDANAWYYLGDAYANLKRYDEAIEAFRQAVRINPENATVWIYLGRAYFTLKRYDESIEALRQVVRINPEDPDDWYNLGFVYYTSGNRTAALNTVKELRRLDPEKADKLFNLIVPR
ncbi:MAG: tetratricopeptide repeat-containing serine protease family protein [Deltaproteobacteria bacterium]|nr:tetratricopeptide repeat-containing serine protease family protein [Deltaproteobacteria bacterium]